MTNLLVMHLRQSIIESNTVRIVYTVKGKWLGDFKLTE